MSVYVIIAFPMVWEQTLNMKVNKQVVTCREFPRIAIPAIVQN